MDYQRLFIKLFASVVSTFFLFCFVLKGKPSENEEEKTTHQMNKCIHLKRLCNFSTFTVRFRLNSESTLRRVNCPIFIRFILFRSIQLNQLVDSVN